MARIKDREEFPESIRQQETHANKFREDSMFVVQRTIIEAGEVTSCTIILECYGQVRDFKHYTKKYTNLL